MTLPARQTDSRARSLVMWWCAVWLSFCSAWLLLLMTRGRWVPGLHGPGTLGKFLLVVGVCFVGAAISAIAAAGVTVSRRGALSRRFLVMGVAPIICMVLLIVVPPAVEWGMNMYHIWLPAP